MNVIVFLDDNHGMLFNKRRQSRDQAVIEAVRQLTQDSVLWMNDYSYPLYGKQEGVSIQCDIDFLQKAGPGEYALVENNELVSVVDRIESLFVFKWNRVYPSDKKLDFDLNTWKKISEKEFKGNSHEKILLEQYTRSENS